jgi:hypothetical protein
MLIKSADITYPNIIRFIGNALFLMLILVFLLDPANTILHKKDVVFILLTGFCIVFYKPDLSKLPYIGALIAAILIPYLFSLIAMRNIDPDDVLPIFKAISPSILLLWIREFDLLKLSRMPVIFASLIMDILFLVILIFPETEGPIYLFAAIESETVQMAHRWFLGVQMFCMYLRSTIAFTFVLTYFLYICISKDKRTIMALIALAIVFFYFTFAGTRSSMLVPWFLAGIVCYAVYRNHPRAKMFFYPLLAAGAVLFIILIVALATETEEVSNAVKYGHITSYTSLFEQHPLYLIFGQGPGAWFYSDGFNKYVLQTEWTYLELIRWFGLCSLLIIGVFFRPLLTFWKHRSDALTFSLLWTYAAYLVIAGTNPLMLSSTGMIMLLTAYSYQEQITRVNHPNS